MMPSPETLVCPTWFLIDKRSVPELKVHPSPNRRTDVYLPFAMAMERFLHFSHIEVTPF
jgi:hypothetical protein